MKLSEKAKKLGENQLTVNLHSSLKNAILSIRLTLLKQKEESRFGSIFRTCDARSANKNRWYEHYGINHKAGCFVCRCTFVRTI